MRRDVDVDDRHCFADSMYFVHRTLATVVAKVLSVLSVNSL